MRDDLIDDADLEQYDPDEDMRLGVYTLLCVFLFYAVVLYGARV